MAKALSIKQPWAWAIIEEGKNVENRTWPPSHGYRGPLYIHAGLKWAWEGFKFLDEHGHRLPFDPPRGGIIGVVDLVDCVEGYDSPWAFGGEYHWILKNPRRVRFKPMAGKLGIWDVDLRRSIR